MHNKQTSILKYKRDFVSVNRVHQGLTILRLCTRIASRLDKPLSHIYIVFLSYKFQKYRLGFDYEDTEKRWCGCAASIYPASDNLHVWGCVWTLDNADMTSLDEWVQQLLHTTLYSLKSLPATLLRTFELLI